MNTPVHPSQFMKAPFFYFGGKAWIADEVWKRLGSVENYIEPFAGSIAVLLKRPLPFKGVETINDRNAYVTNFWRAVKADPAQVASFADWPVNEIDLHSRHEWLVHSAQAVKDLTRVREDPEFYSAKIAGWWVWGLSCWIGSGWCSRFGSRKKQMPMNKRRGIHAGEAKAQAAGFQNQQGAVCISEVHESNQSDFMLSWLNSLRARLRGVKILGGDWLRTCDSDSMLFAGGPSVGVFLDSPYRVRGRDKRVDYNDDSTPAQVDSLVDSVIEYCAQRGSRPEYRIAACGYAGDGYERLEALGWDCLEWKANGGFGNRTSRGTENATRERIWFSPHCERPAPDLFAPETLQSMKGIA